MRAKQKGFFQDFLLKHPIQVSLILFIIMLVLRVIEIFILKLDEVWGEIFVSKLLGFLIIIGYLWLVKRKVRDIGLHSIGVRIRDGDSNFVPLILFKL